MALAATTCWFIWKERCLGVFEDKARSPEQLAIAITRHFAYWHPERKAKTTEISCTILNMNISWNLPVVNTFKLNCDASWLSELTNAGFGLIIRNWTGTFQAAEIGCCRTFSAEEVEVVALLKATQWAIRNNMQNLVIEGDNQATIWYLQGNKVNVQLQCVAILEEVRVLTDQLVSFLGFQHVDRRANKVANLLAKKGRSSSSTVSWND
ncbi:uncharacterized protein LOC113294519 [Papaver somniferum]|uniref:uncharacterized protein LOC113294519 n=1 Tax=Papaver somniferum TaxID=3469 RepID=UPI000E6FF547|nr:uncharacterized protein LOC113294519 [Papaver somniferum]